MKKCLLLLISLFLLLNPIYVFAEPKLRTIVELGLLKNKDGTIKGSLENAVPEIVRVGDTISVYGRLSMFDESGVKVGGVPNVKVKLMDIFVELNPVLLATATTDKDGFFVFEWKVESKLKPEDIEGVKEGRTSIDHIKLKVIGVFDGNDKFAPSTSIRYDVKLKPLTLDITLTTDKSLYVINERAKIDIDIKDINRINVDPESIIAFFDNDLISLTRESIGRYSFVTAPLSEGIHILTIVPEYKNYLAESRKITITTSSRIEKDVEINISLNERYRIGDLVNISGTVTPIMLEHPVVIQLKTPEGKTYSYSATVINDQGRFSYDIRIMGLLATEGKWSVSVVYAGKEVSKEFEIQGISKPPPLQFDIRIIDVNDTDLNQANVNDKIGIEASITNTSEMDRGFVYLVRIIRDDVTLQVSWIKVDKLQSYADAKPVIFWIPESTGIYNIDAFLWSDIDEPVIFAESRSININIS